MGLKKLSLGAAVDVAASEGSVVDAAGPSFVLSVPAREHYKKTIWKLSTQ